MKTSDILKYRSAWLGFAMLWIVWCHWGVYPGFYPIAFLKNMGYGGVDICLLASAMRLTGTSALCLCSICCLPC